MPRLSIDIDARLASLQDSVAKIGREAEQLSGRLNKAFGAVRTGIAALGVGLSAGGFAAFVKSGIDAADNLNKLSQKVGVTVESLSALEYAAKLSDVSSEQLSSGLARLARSASDAAAGSKESAEAFAAIGVAVKDAAGNLRGTEDLLGDLAEKFAGMEDSAGKTALAMRFFGRSGAELIPFLNLGRSGMAELRSEAERLGIVMSGETAKAAEEFNDNMTRLGTQVDKLKFSLTQSLLPALGRVAEGMADAVRNGEGFLGLLKAMTRLSSFDDLQRAQRELVDVTDRLLVNQAKLDRLGTSSFAEDAGKAIAQKIEADKKRANELIKLLGVLRGETDAFGGQAIQSPATKKAPAPSIPSTTGPDQGQQFLDTLRKRLLAIEQDEYAVLRLEAAQKKVLAAAEPLITALQRQTEFQKQHAEAVQRDAAAQEAEQQRRFALVDGVAKYVEQLEEETALQKLSNEQRLITVQLLRLEQAGISSTSEEFAAAAERIRAAVNAAAGAQVVESMKGPLERARDELLRLNDLYAAGALTIDQYRAAVEKLNEEFRKSQEAGKSTTDVAKEIGLTFSSAFEEAVSGGKSFRDILKGIEQDLLKLGTRKLVTEPLLDVFSNFLKPKDGGGSNIIGSIFSSIFGGGKAEGGPVEPGRGYIVGERGPEWFMPRSAGTIIPNGAGAGAINYSPTFVIRGDMNPQSRSQLAAAAYRGLQEGRRNL